MEGGADALRRFAVPTPVIELFADQTAREALRRVPRSRRQARACSR
jgi:hypothetical protein